MGQHTSDGIHHHGYVEDAPLNTALSAHDRLSRLDVAEVLHTPEEVAQWLATTLRAAMGKSEDDVAFSDEWDQWVKYAQAGETVTTGLRHGPTISVVAVPEDDCRCEATPLVPVGGKKRSR
ncbi:hypothetical protein [Haloactinomyces albus]|uniref:Uncharacterized protein n=1 Tax=Haloactinomyces albus TaxID=1352928 RepID=A0AAE3ZDG3_9ACTN|nr:hypothetical protein [Haloactinomyces albus]MDR7302883.1 hypothetical protein [Haloactinomyces albus]